MTPPRIAAFAAALTLGATLTGCSSGTSGGTVSSLSGMSTGNSSSVAQQPAAPAAAAAAPAAAADTAAAAPAAAPAAAAPAFPVPESERKLSTKAAAKADTSAHAMSGMSGSTSTTASQATSALGIPDAALAGRSISYNAEETLKVEDVSKGVSSIEASVAAAGGMVANSERSGSGDGATANMVLKVPPGGFNSFLDRIGKLGDVSERTLSGVDLTEQVADVAGRIDSRRKSVDRVRALMAQASNLRDVVTLEGELANRESELEALLAKQQKLAQQVDLATVTVHLQTKEHPAPPAPHRAEATGFIAGLDNGWGAFTGAVVATATVLGAVLPFALVLLVLLPIAYLVRRVRRTNDPTPS